MGSPLFVSFDELGFSLTHKIHSLRNVIGCFLLGISNSSCLVSIRIGSDFGSLSHSILNYLSLDQFRIGQDLILLQLGFSIDRLDGSLGFGLPISLCLASLGLDFLGSLDFL